MRGRTPEPPTLSVSTLSIGRLTKQQIERAALLVASNAHDVDDARYLLEAIGLIDPIPPLPECRPLDPSSRAKAWQRAQKRLADEETE